MSDGKFQIFAKLETHSVVEKGDLTIRTVLMRSDGCERVQWLNPALLNPYMSAQITAAVNTLAKVIDRLCNRGSHSVLMHHCEAYVHSFDSSRLQTNGFRRGR